jgi:hypothetical protein
LLIIVALSAALALVSHYTGSEFDPIKEIQKLKSQNRRDDALDLVKFFKENQTEEKDVLNKLEKDLEYTSIEKMKSFTVGAVKGEVYDTYSGVGAITADLCVIGDLRDLGIQSWKCLTDNPDFDKTVAILSGIGVALSLRPFIHGINSLTKNSVKYVKSISKFVKGGILSKFLSGKIPLKDSKMVWQLLKKTNGQSHAPLPTFPTYAI